MLPLIIGGVVVAVVGSILNESQKKSKQKYKKKLQKKHQDYSSQFQKKVSQNNLQKQSILFEQIKREQSKLKKERRHLAAIRNSLQRGTDMHQKIIKQINVLTAKIEQKQQDADRIRIR